MIIVLLFVWLLIKINEVNKQFISLNNKINYISNKVMELGEFNDNHNYTYAIREINGLLNKIYSRVYNINTDITITFKKYQKTIETTSKHLAKFSSILNNLSKLNSSLVHTDKSNTELKTAQINVLCKNPANK